MLYMFGCQHLLGLTCICNQMHVWEVLFACHGGAELLLGWETSMRAVASHLMPLNMMRQAYMIAGLHQRHCQRLHGLAGTINAG